MKIFNKIVTSVVLLFMMFFLVSCGKVKTHNVVFKNYDGEILKEELVKQGEAATPPQDPKREGYTFDGWSVDFTKIENDLEVVATYTQKTYQVVFKDDSDKTIVEKSIKHGEAATPPEAPSKVGYTFIGWDHPLNNITSDLIVSAQYEINLYKVKFETFGGTPVEDMLDVPHSTKIVLPSTTKDGYAFVGWSWNSNTYENTFLVEENVTFNAIWTPIVNYTITFDTDGGDLLSPITAEAYKEVSTLPTPTKTNYAFDGWLLNGELIEVPFKYTFDANITLVATWKGLVDGISFEITDNEVTILSYSGSKTELVIPNTIEELPVTKVEEGAFKNNKTIEKLTFGSNLSDVGAEAFMNMTNLLELHLPVKTKTFGINVLKGSNKLEIFTLSSEASNELSYYFGSDINLIPNSLSKIKYPDGATLIDNTLFTSSNNITLELADDWTTIDNNQFEKTTIKHIIIPKGVTSIGDNAFENATNLTTITFLEDSQLQSIGKRAFAGVNNLTDLYLPESITTVGDYVFSGNKYLRIYSKAPSQPSGWSTTWRQLEIPMIWGYKKHVDDGVLEYALSIHGAYVIKQLDKSTVEDIIIPKKIEDHDVIEINGIAFKENSKIKSIMIPNSVTNIGMHSFANAINFETVTFEENSQLTTIGSRAFSDASALKNIVIPESVTNISNGAFLNAKSLTKVVIPEGVISIGNAAFYQTNLRSIIIPEGVEIIEVDAFNGIENLYILSKLDAQPSGWHSNWKNINTPVIWNYQNTVSDDTFEYVITSDGAYVTKQLEQSTVEDIIIPNQIQGQDVKEIIISAFRGNNKIKSVRIPSSITYIGRYAFGDATNLQSVTFEENSNLTIMDYASFKNTNITSIIIPKSVTRIANETFMYVKSLTTVTFEEESQLEIIDNWAFCETSLTAIEIPKNVTTINFQAFRETNLTNIVIPQNVTRMWKEIFIGVENVNIFAEAASKPSDWHQDWNSENKPVYWQGEWHYDENGVPTPNTP